MTYTEFLNTLSNPAKNALLHEGINSFERLCMLSEKDILKIHGIGPKSLPAIYDALAKQNLSLKSQ